MLRLYPGEQGQVAEAIGLGEVAPGLAASAEPCGPLDAHDGLIQELREFLEPPSQHRPEKVLSPCEMEVHALRSRAHRASGGPQCQGGLTALIDEFARCRDQILPQPLAVSTRVPSSTFHLTSFTRQPSTYT